MFKIKDLFMQIDICLPDKEKCKSFSIYPLPYDGYFEVYVETASGKKFRALSDVNQKLSTFSEFKLPGVTK